MTSPPQKKQRLEDGVSLHCISEAARLNDRVLRKIQKALEENPEADIAALLPKTYSSRLAEGKAVKGAKPLKNPVPTPPPATPPPEPYIYLPSDPATIVHPLSNALNTILGLPADTSTTQGHEITTALAKLLQNSEVIWRHDTSNTSYVVNCGGSIAVKCVQNSQEYTEYTSLQFLEKHKPHIPVPKPHGLLSSGSCAFIFMSLIPGTTVSKIWSTLYHGQKTRLQNDINGIFLDLRQLKCPEGTPLGGTAGEGCKDARRRVRRSSKPMYNSEEFWKFQYLDSNCRSEIYSKFLGELTYPLRSSNCVFTHGDVHPTNIMVERDNEGKYHISGIIDWERSGFYPEDFECTKITNNLSSLETDDWYLYLPECIAPSRHPARWLADLTWDHYVV